MALPLTPLQPATKATFGTGRGIIETEEQRTYESLLQYSKEGRISNLSVK